MAGNVERQIQEAMERGEFDNLPGAGKPLRLRHLGDPEWFAKSLMEREGLDKIVPAPVALRDERRALPETLDGLRDESAVRAVLEDFNRRVRDAVLRDARVIVGGVRVEEYVAAWRERQGISRSDD